MAYLCSKDPSHQSTDSDYCSICGAKIAGAPSALNLTGNGSAAVSMSMPGVTTPPVAGGNEMCPDCGTPRHPGAKFCEICRYNFDAHRSASGIATVTPAASVTAAAPPPPPPTPPPPTSPPVSDVGYPPPLEAIPVADPVPPVPAPAAPTAPTLDPQAALLKWEAVVSVDPSLYTDPDPNLPLPTDEPERTFPLDFAENLLGRRSDRKDIHPEIPVGDAGVSHRHAKLLRQPDGSFVLLDVGSTNGTKLNGVEIQPGVRTPLRDGDQITVGCWTRITIRSHAG